jgi:hypothetical protein
MRQIVRAIRRDKNLIVVRERLFEQSEIRISVNSKKGFVFAQKNAARCISGQDKKNILGIGNPKQKDLRRATAFFCA